MPTLNEQGMLTLLDSATSVLLVEPNYTRKHVPLGLAKIAGYLTARGVPVRFSRGADANGDFDLICVTTLFTYDCTVIHDAYREASFFHPGVPVLVGGIYASLMAHHAQTHMPTASIFPGYSQTLDQCPPAYGMDWLVDDEWGKFSYTFTTRGCVSHCGYCAVPRLEPGFWINPRWREMIVDDKPWAMISDNNLSAAPPEHIEAVVSHLRDHGKRVNFNNGFDCKLVTDDLATMLGTLKYVRCGMRLSFDRIEEDGVFQTAVTKLVEAGVQKKDIMAFVLYNFTDTPRDADYRLRECAHLGVRPYPQMFLPLNTTSRGRFHVGAHWTKNLARAFRTFWMMGYYRDDARFDDFMREPAVVRRFNLTETDYEAWRGEKK